MNTPFHEPIVIRRGRGEVLRLLTHYVRCLTLAPGGAPAHGRVTTPDERPVTWPEAWWLAGSLKRAP